MAAGPFGVAAILSQVRGGDYLTSSDLSSDQTRALLDLATQLKQGSRRIDLGNRVVTFLPLLIDSEIIMALSSVTNILAALPNN